MMALGTDLSNIISQAFNNTLISGLTVAKSATLTRKSALSYSPTTGAITGTPATESRKMIVREYRVDEVARSAGLIEIGDVEIRVLDEISLNVPARQDEISVDSMTFRLVNVRRVQLDGSDALFVCQGRK